MHGSLIAAFAALTVCASFLCGNAQAQEAATPLTGELVLIGVRTEDEAQACEIRTLSLDGAASRTLFRRDGADIVPGGRQSPGRDRIAFCIRTNDGEGDGEFWVFELAGDARKVADGSGTITAWSPSGDSIAAYRAAPDGASYESIVVDVSSGETKTLELPDEYVADDWRASDGMRTATFQNSRNFLYRESKGDRYPTRQLDLLTPDGTRTPVTKNPSSDNIWSRFSPNGDRIAYYARRLVGEKSLEHVAVCDGDGTASREIFCFTTYGDERGLPWFRPSRPPAWAPDGSALAWLVNTNGVPDGQGERLEAMLFPLDGTDPMRIDLTKIGIEYVSTIEWR